MKKNFLLFVMILLSSIPLTPVSFADKGIFQPKVVPDEIMKDRLPATVIVTAEIGDVPPNKVEVSLYQTLKDGHPVRLLCPMQINIKTGFFVGNFTISDKKDAALYSRITAVYNDREAFNSPVQKVLLLDPLPKGSVPDLSGFLGDLKGKFLAYRMTHDLDTARNMVLKDARKNPDMKASLSGNDLSVLFKDKIRGIVSLDDPFSPPTDWLK